MKNSLSFLRNNITKILISILVISACTASYFYYRAAYIDGTTQCNNDTNAHVLAWSIGFLIYSVALLLPIAIMKKKYSIPVLIGMLLLGTVIFGIAFLCLFNCVG